MSEIKKVERDGKIAVIYSPEYGTGMDSGHYRGDPKQMRFDPEIVELILDGRRQEDDDLANERYGCERYRFFEGLDVMWIAKGRRFCIDEYDGSESFSYPDAIGWMTA